METARVSHMVAQCQALPVCLLTCPWAWQPTLHCSRWMRKKLLTNIVKKSLRHYSISQRPDKSAANDFPCDCQHIRIMFQTYYIGSSARTNSPLQGNASMGLLLADGPHSVLSTFCLLISWFNADRCQKGALQHSVLCQNVECHQSGHKNVHF